jgi:hypothetical protein
VSAARRAVRIVGIALSAIAVVAMSSCNGDDEPERSAEEQRFIDDLAVVIEEDPEFPLSRTKSECFAVALVDALEYERLADLGITPAALYAAQSAGDLGLAPPPEATNALANGIDDCDLKPEFAEQVLAEIPLEGEPRQCLVDAIVDDPAVADLLARVFLGGETDPVARLGRTFAKCPESMSDLMLDAVRAQGVQIPEFIAACFRAEVAERAGEVARVMSSGDAAAQAELGASIGFTCRGGVGAVPN